MGWLKKNAGIIGAVVGGLPGYLIGNSIQRKYEGGDGGGNIGIDYSKQPQYPTYQQGYDPTKQSNLPQLQQELSGLGGITQQGLRATANQAFSRGASPWAQLAQNRQRLQEQAQRDQLQKEGAARQAEARSALAMRGGLSSGARERLARSGMRDQLLGAQDVSRQGAQSALQIGMQDEANRQKALQAIPSMAAPGINMAQLGQQTRAFDTQQQVDEAARRNQFDLAKYQSDMAAWAAGQQAMAMAQPAPKFLGIF